MTGSRSHMGHLSCLFLAAAILAVMALAAKIDAANGKIAYKKSIYETINDLKEEPTKEKAATESPKKAKGTTAKTTIPATDFDEPVVELSTQDYETIIIVEEATGRISDSAEATDVQENNKLAVEEASTAATITSPEPTKPKTVAPKTTAPSNLPVPCTCGVFMTSQLKRNSAEPVGDPVISNEIERSFPCNAIGRKQCQTKCLEMIVQHLPSSANILCATLNRDCHKERAYLFVKNCRNQWWNTTLTAGRDYCCKKGQPYKCPLV